MNSIFTKLSIQLTFSAVSLGVIAAPISKLEEVVIFSPAYQVSEFEANYAISSVTQQQIQDRAYRTVPQALRDIPGVMVQETSFGQGSPFIRGFTGFRNVFLVDGFKLNNSVMREGPNQYWSTVDAFSLQKLEVINGPSAVLYGSDAIGGAVYALTGEVGENGIHSYTRLASAESSYTQRLDWSHRINEQHAFKVGVTAKDYGDLRGGSDVGDQPNTGYTEWDGDIKWSSQLANWTFDLLHQTVTQNNVPRTHKTESSKSWEGTSVGSDKRRELDQSRRFSYIKVGNNELDAVVDSLSIAASHTKTEESRDRIRASGAQEFQGFDVDSLGLLFKLGKNTVAGSLTLGVDYYHDDVDSFSSRNEIQGPVGDDARYSTLDFYLHDRLDLGRMDLNAGVRHTSVSADADSVSDPITGGQISISQDWSEWVSSIGLGIELVPDSVRLFAGINQGFRAPNLSDLSRFDSARSNEFEVPAPNLDPERFVSYEVGLKYQGKTAGVRASLYYTDVEDMIILFPTGNMIDGEFEITKDNLGDGFVKGVEVRAHYSPDDKIMLYGELAWMDSQVSVYPTSEQILVDEPVSREMPFIASLGARYSASEKLWFELEADYAAKADQLSTRDKSDGSRIPPGGTPDFTVLHLRSGYKLNDHVNLTLGIDNLLNEDYRVHGSGTNMPGRNFVLGLAISL